MRHHGRWQPRVEVQSVARDAVFGEPYRRHVRLAIVRLVAVPAVEPIARGRFGHAPRLGPGGQLVDAPHSGLKMKFVIEADLRRVLQL